MWAEDKMRQLENSRTQRDSNSELLYEKLFKVRLEKQKVHDMEQALLGIKNKIEQLRLDELNREISSINQSSKDLYARQEMINLGQRIEEAVKAQVQRRKKAQYVIPFDRLHSVHIQAQPIQNIKQEVREREKTI